jgi:death-on-curing family protein
MFDIDKNDIIELNKSLNDDLDGWWCKKELLDSCFSSYYYYETLLEQICSIFRGIVKNHSFSNANKRTGAIVLVTLLELNGFTISDDNLIKITMDVSEHNYEVTEISDKLSKLITPTN